MRINQTHSSMLISPMRIITGKVEHYSGSTLLNTFEHTGALSSFKVTRTASKKFFGYGVTQSLELKLIDKTRSINIENESLLSVSYGVNNSFYNPYPQFNVTEVIRNENNNDLSVKAVDLILLNGTKRIVSELNITYPVTVQVLANACASALGMSGAEFTGVSALNLTIDQLNVDGNEPIRSLLDDIAEATQTIYYQDANKIVFKRLNISGSAVLSITKSDYFTLTDQEPCVLNAIASSSELGENVISKLNEQPYTQFVHENSIWALRTDIASLLDSAVAAVGGLSITPFNCKWRGNYLLEIGDKIEITKKNNTVMTSYLLEEQTTYNGGLNSIISWAYDPNATDTFTNPATLGDKLNQTFAKVDKTKQEIDLVAKNVEDVVQEQAAIKLTTDSITSSVELLGQATENNSNKIENLSTKLEQTAEDLRLEIKQEILDGTPDKVTTVTGFTFNEDGLTISKTSSEMSTQITEDGLTIYRNNEEMLIADNEGVYAANLNATTFFIMGDNSRFEDYQNRQRTGCFWIGGV